MLIVNADDFGLTSDINNGIIEVIEKKAAVVPRCALPAVEGVEDDGHGDEEVGEIKVLLLRHVQGMDQGFAFWCVEEDELDLLPAEHEQDTGGLDVPQVPVGNQPAPHPIGDGGVHPLVAAERQCQERAEQDDRRDECHGAVPVIRGSRSRARHGGT